MAWWAETDRIRCKGTDGRTVDVVVQQKVSEVGIGLAYGPPIYQTSSGEPVKRLDGNIFVLPDGNVLVRSVAG